MAPLIHHRGASELVDRKLGRSLVMAAGALQTCIVLPVHDWTSSLASGAM